MLVLKVHDLCKIRVSGDETTGHALAVVGKELSDSVVESLELISITEADTVLRIEEDCRTTPLLN